MSNLNEACGFTVRFLAHSSASFLWFTSVQKKYTDAYTLSCNTNDLICCEISHSLVLKNKRTKRKLMAHLRSYVYNILIWFHGILKNHSIVAFLHSLGLSGYNPLFELKLSAMGNFKALNIIDVYVQNSTVTSYITHS